MQDNHSLAASDLQLQYIPGTSPVGMRTFKDRKEMIAVNPPAEQKFALAPRAAKEAEMPWPVCSETSLRGRNLRSQHHCQALLEMRYEPHG